MTKPVAGRLRWFQFSLRSFLAVLILLSIGLIAVVVPAERQRQAVEELQAAGATVAYEYAYGSGYRSIKAIVPPGPSWQRRKYSIHYFVDVRAVWDFHGELSALRRLADLPQLEVLILDGKSLSDAELRHLRGLSQLKILEINHSPIDGSGLDLANLRHLEELSLFQTSLNDAGAQRLEGLDQLCSLDISGTKITDQALVSLSRLKRLQSLDLSNTALSDAGLPRLAETPRLEVLCLANTQVTDAGLVWLTSLSNLRVLDLRGTKVTSDGVSLLEAKMPRLQELYQFGFAAGPQSIREMKRSRPTLRVAPHR